MLSSLSRLREYRARHGLGATVRRLALGLRRAFSAGRTVLFYCDLDPRMCARPDLAPQLKLEQIRNEAELAFGDLQEMLHVGSATLARQQMKERFAKGASLWLVKIDDCLAGFGWTMRGSTIEGHYFPLGDRDAHLFNFHVFPPYRGRGLNPVLVEYILDSLAADGVRRAFIEAAEWNDPQLSSLKKTRFEYLGVAAKQAVFGRTMVVWAPIRRLANEYERSERAVRSVIEENGTGGLK